MLDRRYLLKVALFGLVGAAGHITFPVVALAQDDDPMPEDVATIGSEELMVNGTRISVTDDGVVRAVTLDGPDGSGALVLDRARKTIYSSLTGKTIDIEDLTDGELLSDRSVSTRADYYMSYREIRNTVGTVATATELAAAFMAACPQTVLLGDTVREISSVFGVAEQSVADDPNHGIVFYRTKSWYMPKKTSGPQVLVPHWIYRVIGVGRY